MIAYRNTSYMEKSSFVTISLLKLPSLKYDSFMVLLPSNLRLLNSIIALGPIWFEYNWQGDRIIHTVVVV